MAALATTLETDDCVLAVLAAADLHTIQAAKAVSRRFCSLGRATLRSAEWLSLRRNLGDLGLAGWAGGVAIQLDTCVNERGTEFVHPRNGTRCVSISSRWVACAGDGDVQLWERQTGEYKLRVRHSHHAQVLSVHLRDDLLVVGLDSFPFVSLHRVCERLTDQGRRSEYVLVDLPTVGLGNQLFNARAAWLSDTRLVACVERGEHPVSALYPVDLEPAPARAPREGAGQSDRWAGGRALVHPELARSVAHGGVATDRPHWVTCIAVGHGLVACASEPHHIVEAWAPDCAPLVPVRRTGDAAPIFALAVLPLQTSDHGECLCVVSGGDDETLRIWCALNEEFTGGDEKMLRDWRAIHAGGNVWAIAAGERVLASGGTSRADPGSVCVHLWCLRSLGNRSAPPLLRKLVDAPQPQPDASRFGVRSLAFPPGDDLTLLCGSDDGVVRLWSLKPVGPCADAPPPPPFAPRHHGLSLLNEGQFEAARAHLADAVRGGPEDAVLRWHLAIACFALGGIAEGADNIAAAAELGMSWTEMFWLSRAMNGRPARALLAHALALPPLWLTFSLAAQCGCTATVLMLRLMGAMVGGWRTMADIFILYAVLNLIVTLACKGRCRARWWEWISRRLGLFGAPLVFLVIFSFGPSMIIAAAYLEVQLAVCTADDSTRLLCTLPL